jgi:fermentation-respiration switch protein FrsA (DUF1100 family)
LLGSALPACAVQVGEEQLLRPVAGATLSQETLAAMAPAYTLTRHTIAAADGAKLHAVHLTQPGAVTTILYFGGNGYTIERFGALTARALAPLKANVMIVDHRGYGLSEGKPTAANVQSDGVAAFDYLSGLPGLDRSRIVVHGQSLGSFVAGHVAASRPTAAVVLESSITTTEEWVKARAGKAPVRVTVSDSLKGQGNLRNLPLITEPMLLLVGREDKITPPALSQALYQRSPLPENRKALVVVAGAGHNDVLLQASAIEAYRAFLEGIGAPGR